MSESSNKGCVLIVDDEVPLLELIEEAFIDEGFRVMTAKNGHEALGVILSKSIDIVVSDIRMPGMGGLELRSICRSMPDKDPSIWIALTAHVDGDRGVVDLSSFQESFFKPYSPQILARLCRKLQDKSPLQSAL
jgi:CheY-like chemotaxis protein